MCCKSIDRTFRCVLFYCDAIKFCDGWIGVWWYAVNNGHGFGENYGCKRVPMVCDGDVI